MDFDKQFDKLKYVDYEQSILKPVQLTIHYILNFQQKIN